MSKVTIAALATVAGIGLAAGAAAAPVQVLRNNALTTVDTATPGTATTTTAITGIGTGQTLTGIDYRPANPRLLYGLSNTGQLYAINGRTGSATAVGSPVAAAATGAAAGTGFDFNPTVDRIRVVTSTGTNLRLNPNNGAVAATDGGLLYAGIDPNAGQVPTAAGAAYTNNVAGATSTTLYVVDTRGGTAPARLVTQGNASVSPNTGVLFTVGSTGVTTTAATGFDIGRDGAAYATFTNPTTGVTSLYTVNLTTGAATLVGALSGNTTYTGLAVQLASFQSLGATANQAAVGTALDNFTGVPSDQTLAIFNAIDTSANPSAVLQSLSPAAYADLPLVALNAVESQEIGVLRRARDLRGDADATGQDSATLDADGRVTAWINGGSRFGTLRPATDRYRTRMDDYHFLGGVDYRLGTTTAIGAFGGYAQTRAKMAAGQLATVENDSWFGGVYGSAAVGPVHLDAWGSYTDIDMDLNRSLLVGAVNGTAFANTGGRVWAAGAAAGVNLGAAGLEIEPYAAIRYADVRIDGFTETNSASFALGVGRIRDEALRGELGARIGKAIDVGGGTVFRPQVRGGYYHDFMQGRRPFTATFQQASIGSTFAFQPTPFSQDYWHAGATLSASGTGPLSMFADFDYQGDQERRFYNVSIGARVRF